MGSKAEDIEKYILKIIEMSENDTVELQRTDLSYRFSCVPSQINYVLNTRFTTSRGYIVESRRGGGGYLRIVKLPISREDDILRLIADSEGQELSETAASGLIGRLVEEEVLTPREGRLMEAVLKNSALEQTRQYRDLVRMDLVRALILAILREK